MKLENLKLVNFRNYESLSIDFNDGINIIYGKNAAGKTNILEAASLFSSGRSFRVKNEKDLILFEKDFSKINITFEAQKRKNTAEMIISDKKKLIKINEVPLERTSELLGFFSSVLFSPEEISLISGSPEGRRSFLNLYISSQRPSYYSSLKNYKKILKQKNILLKQGDNGTLSLWNEKLAENGARIMLFRKKFIDELIPYAAQFHKEISGDEFTIKYNTSFAWDKTETKEELYEKFLNAIEKKKEAEMALGASLVGPHRDDMEFIINGKSAMNFASQGQQRTAVISLKIAQTQKIKDLTGEYPILLLDDIMSELDSRRRDFLVNKIKDMQVIITCTDPIKSENAKYFKVSEGRVCT